MMISSNTFTFQMDAMGVDPRMLELPNLSSDEALVAAIHECLPDPPQSEDDFTSPPGLVADDGSSQSSGSSPPCTPLSTPQSYANLHLYPQEVHIDYRLPYSPATPASPELSRASASRVLAKAPCGGGRPIKQKGGGYRCSVCEDIFKRRDDAKRHIDSAGMRVACKYCGKSASGRRDGQRRHLFENKACLKKWEAGYQAGLFETRTVEDAYHY